MAISGPPLCHRFISDFSLSTKEKSVASSWNSCSSKIAFPKECREQKAISLDMWPATVHEDDAAKAWLRGLLRANAGAHLT